MINIADGELRECYCMLDDLMMSSDLLVNAPNLTKQEFFENHWETIDRLAQMFDIRGSSETRYRKNYDHYSYVYSVFLQAQDILVDIAEGFCSEEDYRLLRLDEVMDLLGELQMWFDDKYLEFKKKGDLDDSK